MYTRDQVIILVGNYANEVALCPAMKQSRDRYDRSFGPRIWFVGDLFGHWTELVRVRLGIRSVSAEIWDD